VKYYHQFSYRYILHTSYLYQILMTVQFSGHMYFDKNIERAMSTNPVAEE